MPIQVDYCALAYGCVYIAIENDDVPVAFILPFHTDNESYDVTRTTSGFAVVQGRAKLGRIEIPQGCAMNHIPIRKLEVSRFP